METNKDIELGWLVGMIDGEGCLHIRIHHRKTKHYGVRPRFSVALNITNTEEEMTVRCAQQLDSMGIKNRQFFRDRKDKGKRQYCVDVGPTGLRLLLPQIKNLSCKHAQMDILLEALEISLKNKCSGHQGAWGRQPMTGETLEKMDSLRMKLTELHGRQSKKLIRIKASDYDITQYDVERVGAMLKKKVPDISRMGGEAFKNKCESKK